MVYKETESFEFHSYFAQTKCKTCSLLVLYFVWQNRMPAQLLLTSSVAFLPAPATTRLLTASSDAADLAFLPGGASVYVSACQLVGRCMLRGSGQLWEAGFLVCAHFH